MQKLNYNLVVHQTRLRENNPGIGTVISDLCTAYSLDKRLDTEGLIKNLFARINNTLFDGWYICYEHHKYKKAYEKLYETIQAFSSELFEEHRIHPGG